MSRLCALVILFFFVGTSVAGEKPGAGTQDRELLKRLSLVERELEDLALRQAELEKRLDALQEKPTAWNASFSEEDINSFVRAVVPHVERIAGRKFKTIPPIVVGDSERVAEILAGDIEPMVRKNNPQLDDEQAAEAALDSAERLMPVLLGKYGVEAKTLGLMPENLIRTLKTHRIDRKYARDIMKILIAHELTHALQAQYVDINHIWLSRRTADESAAYTAVVEGHCMFVQDNVGEALGLGPAVREYSRTFSSRDLALRDPAAVHAARIQTARHEFTYVTGKRFIAYHYRRGGAEAAWRILDKPPVATSMVARPETYSPIRPKGPDFTKVLAGLAQSLREKKWAVGERELGEVDLRATYAAMEASAVDTITGNVLAARNLAAYAANEPAAVQVAFFVLKSKEAGPEMIALLHKSAVKSVEETGKSPAFRVKRFDSSRLEGFPSDASKCYTVILADADGEIILDKRIIRVARNGVVVELVTEDYAIKPERKTQILEEVFRRVDNAKRSPREP